MGCNCGKGKKNTKAAPAGTKTPVPAGNTSSQASAGMVGQTTMKRLLWYLITSTANSRGINPKWIWGQGLQESGFDPGAQGRLTPADLGLWQFNTADGDPPRADAFTPEVACDATTKRFKKALEVTYAEVKPKELRVNCAILQHKSPVAADELARTGHTGDEGDTYIARVRAFADTYPLTLT